jgi:hypothetical protein
VLLTILATRCDIFDVTAFDLIRSTAQNAAPRRTDVAGGTQLSRVCGGELANIKKHHGS